MADSSVAVTAGSGTNIDTRTESTNSNHRQVVVIGDPASNDGVAGVSANGELSVRQPNVVSTNNSTTTPLTGAATFTGTGDDVSIYSAVTITLYADVDSATDGMRFEFSTDNTNWDDTYTFTMDVSASDTRRFQFPVTAQYFRVRYTNGAGAQSAFRVQTILHSNNQMNSVHRLGDNTSPDRSAQVIKSAILARVSGVGDFAPVASSATGKLLVAAEIEDGGNSITIDNADITTIAGAISGTEMQADVLTQPARDNATDTITASLDTAAIMNDTTALTPKFAAIDVTTSGNNTIVSAVSTKKIRVLAYVLVASAAVTVRFEDGAGGTALTGQMQLAANGGVSSGFCPVGFFETSATTLLNLELSGATSVDGHVVYVEV